MYYRLLIAIFEKNKINKKEIDEEIAKSFIGEKP